MRVESSFKGLRRWDQGRWCTPKQESHCKESLILPHPTFEVPDVLGFD